MAIYHVPTHRQQTKARPRNSVAWQKASAAWIKEHPFCALCLVRGRVNECAIQDTCTKQRTLVVDHIEPHRGNMDLFWDQDNWETLCRLCHDIVKQRHERAGNGEAQWYEMLRHEITLNNTHDDAARLLPQHMVLKLDARQGTTHSPGGGVSAAIAQP